jgi:hypothetical protein
VRFGFIVGSVLSTHRTAPLSTAVSLAAQAVMQRLTGAQHQGCRLVNLGAGVTGSVLPRSSVKPCFRGASRFIVQAAQEAPAADSDDDRPSTVRRRRLFRGQSGAAGESSSTGDSSSAGSSNTAPVRQPRRTAEPPRDVLEDFAAAFESTLSRSPKVRSALWSEGDCLLCVIDLQCSRGMHAAVAAACMDGVEPSSGDDSHHSYPELPLWVLPAVVNASSAHGLGLQATVPTTAHLQQRPRCITVSYAGLVCSQTTPTLLHQQQLTANEHGPWGCLAAVHLQQLCPGSLVHPTQTCAGKQYQHPACMTVTANPNS